MRRCTINRCGMRRRKRGRCTTSSLGPHHALDSQHGCRSPMPCSPGSVWFGFPCAAGADANRRRYAGSRQYSDGLNQLAAAGQRCWSFPKLVRRGRLQLPTVRGPGARASRSLAWHGGARRQELRPSDGTWHCQCRLTAEACDSESSGRRRSPLAASGKPGRALACSLGQAGKQPESAHCKIGPAWQCHCLAECQWGLSAVRVSVEVTDWPDWPGAAVPLSVIAGRSALGQ